MVVVDASVLLASEDTDDPHFGSSLDVLTSGLDLATYDLCRLEVVNVALHKWHDPEAAGRLLARIRTIDTTNNVLRPEAALADDILALCAAHPLSACDAGYVAAARRLGATLVSCDERDLVGPGHAVLPAAVLA